MPPVRQGAQTREWLPPLRSLGLLATSATPDGQPLRLLQQLDNPFVPRLALDANGQSEYPYRNRSKDKLSTPEEDLEKHRKSSSAWTRSGGLYKCMVEGCGREYGWKENLSRHNVR